MDAGISFYQAADGGAIGQIGVEVQVGRLPLPRPLTREWRGEAQVGHIFPAVRHAGGRSPKTGDEEAGRVQAHGIEQGAPGLDFT